MEQIIEYVYGKLKQKSPKITRELVTEIVKKNIENTSMNTMDYYKQTAYVLTNNPYDFENEVKEAKMVHFPDDNGYETIISQHVSTIFGDFVPGKIENDGKKTNPEFSINGIQAMMTDCRSATFRVEDEEEVSEFYGRTLYVYVPEKQYDVKMFSDLLSKDNELRELMKLDEELNAKLKEANEILPQYLNLKKGEEK